MSIYKENSIYKQGLSKEDLKGKVIDYEIVYNPYWETKQIITKSILKEYEDYFVWNSFQIQGQAITAFNSTSSDPWQISGGVVICYFDLNAIPITYSRVLFFDYYNGNMDFISASIRWININGVDRLCLVYSDGSQYKRSDAYFNCENFIANKSV